VKLKYVVKLLLLAVLALNTAGCGTFVARSIARAPNLYPTWFDSEAPVTLDFNPRLLTNFVTHYVDVGPPPARLAYRIIEPADYRMKTTSTNWLDGDERKFLFGFQAKLPKLPEPPNQPTTMPHGTVILLHGYGLAQFSMLPWALCLAQNGWRCVLVDLRGHGRSTGDRIYFGCRETNDLSQLLDTLTRDQQVTGPVNVVGESYGAALALRWKTVDPRVHAVVAIAPYASLSNAVMNVCYAYANWMPKAVIRAGLEQLPSVLQVSASELDTTTVLKRRPVLALFVTGGEDKIAPTKDVELLASMASPGSKLIIVPDATHEALTYYFDDLLTPVLAWLAGEK
jgi:pimeloyl-ACP methyl ester carboxylesterase